MHFAIKLKQSLLFLFAQKVVAKLFISWQNRLNILSISIFISIRFVCFDWLMSEVLIKWPRIPFLNGKSLKLYVHWLIEPLVIAWNSKRGISVSKKVSCAQNTLSLDKIAASNYWLAVDSKVIITTDNCKVYSTLRVFFIYIIWKMFAIYAK